MKQHRETRMDRGNWLGDLWNRPEYLLIERGYRIAYPGMVISPKAGEFWHCPEGHVVVLGQTGGNWAACGASRQTVIGQQAGLWSARRKSRQTVIDHRPDMRCATWRAYDNSRQTVINQRRCPYLSYDASEQFKLTPMNTYSSGSTKDKHAEKHRTTKE